MRRCVLLCCCVSMLSGCATYSFAPPSVDMRRVAEEGHNLNSNCSIGESDEVIAHNIAGAGQLIDNFLLSYRCAARQVANGRQHFEIPSLLVTLGGVTAAAFGAPAGVAIGTGAAAAGLNSAKTYYAPRDKLPIMAAAVDALTCVKNESVATDSYGSSLLQKVAGDAPGKTPAISAAAAAGADNGTSVAITAVDQYFTLVESALLSIENITAQRLSSVGGYAPDALISEIKDVQKKVEDAKTAAAKSDASTKSEVVATAAGAAPVPPTTSVTLPQLSAPISLTPEALARITKADGSIATIDQSLADKLKIPKAVLQLNGAKQLVVSGGDKEDVAMRSAIEQTLLHIAQLQPKLQECVIRAKL